MDAIVVEHLHKAYDRGKVVAVDDVSFSIRKGEIFGLLGVNGAGKSTTINMIIGVLARDGGRVTILGHDPERDWEYVRNRVNVATAYHELSDVLTVRENLRVYARIYHVADGEHKIAELLSRFELSRLADQKFEDLSSGEKTRVALCKGLLSDPEVLLLDECTVGLDPDIADKTRSIIKRYNRETGCTILFTSHYMAEVEELCDRIAFMDRGRITEIDTADNLKRTITTAKVELTVREDADRLKVFLAGEKVRLIKAEGASFVFEVSTEDDRLYKVLNKIFAEGFRIRHLHLRQPTLEDLFIRLARRKR